MPMNWRRSPPEIAYLLADSDALLLFADEASLPLARAAHEGGGQEPPIVIIDRSDGPGALSDWLRRGPDGDQAVPVRPGDVAIQPYSSGTHGRSGERRVGIGGCSTFKSRWAPYHSKQNVKA